MAVFARPGEPCIRLPGASRTITGIAAMRPTSLQALTPGEPAQLVFDFYPVSYVFRAGHRVRVRLVTSIGQDYQEPPLNEGRTPTLSLYRGGDRASLVEVPIVE